MKLYHATYDKNFESILFNGLNSKLGKKSYHNSDLNCVYLSSDIELAKWYAEQAKLVDKKDKKKILIYEVDSESLERSRLKRDAKAQQRHQGKCYQYEGTIEYKKLKDFEADDNRATEK